MVQNRNSSTQRELFVGYDHEGTIRQVGRMSLQRHDDSDWAEFEFSDAWLKFAARHGIDSAIPEIAPGPSPVSDRGVCAAIDDSAPDQWGRLLLTRLEQCRAVAESRPARTMNGIDLVLAADDNARVGALRFFAQSGGPLYTPMRHSPARAADLENLMRAVERVEAHVETEADLRWLIACGPALGGSRPTASLHTPDGTQWIAKFPRRDDKIMVERWEAVGYALARRARIRVPQMHLKNANGRSVLLVRRFDRSQDRRIAFASAQNLIGTYRHPDGCSYIDLADAVRRRAAAYEHDLEELWRRIVFNILISHTNDDLRGIGFLHAAPSGWRLAPAFGLNPVLPARGTRLLTTPIRGRDRRASLALAMQECGAFGISDERARYVVREVADAVKSWHVDARVLQVPVDEIDYMADAFEHEELHLALSRDFSDRRVFGRYVAPGSGRHSSAHTATGN